MYLVVVGREREREGTLLTVERGEEENGEKYRRDE